MHVFQAEGEDLLKANEHRALFFFYLQYVSACLIERSWRFLLPLILAVQPNAIQIVAQLGVVA